PDGSAEEQYRRGIILEKLAGISLARGDYESALSRAKDVLKIYDGRLASDDPKQIESRLTAGIASRALGQELAAKQWAEACLAIAKKQVESTADAQSERQQLAMNFRVREVLDLYLSIPAAEIPDADAYQEILN